MRRGFFNMIMGMVIVLGIGNLVTMQKDYENRIDKLDSKYRNEIAEMERSNTERAKEYDEAIYNIINGENYSVTIEHDGQTITYKRENDDSKIGKIFHLKNDVTIKTGD